MRLNLSLKYIVTNTLVLIIVMSLTFWLILQKQEQMIMTQLEMQAKALFKQVVITRRWVADHGGVFIEKLPWVKPNPYLKNAEITDMAGKRYVKENPALVTKQLSRYAEREQLYVFHITSLKLMNKDNAPDAFETAALTDFEEKQKTEAVTTELIGKSYYYRYIAPLYVEKACLECHSRQGYKVGDVRGAISVSIPMDYARTMILSERRTLITGMIVICIFLTATLYLITHRLVLRPINRIRSQMSQFLHSKKAPPTAGDEIEDLGRTFNDMAGDLQEYHSCLEERINAATSELTGKNEALERSYRSKADFIAKTSHELRTPLTAIKGAMDYLSVKLSRRGNADEDTDILIFFEMIKKNAERMIRLLNNILDYERIELGTFDMRFREVNLKDAFQEVIAGFTPLAEQKQVAIRMRAVDVTAFVDEDRMKQVLTNLISNALNFSPPLSSIIVSVECRDDQVEVAVEDQGSGVQEGEREMIFRQFYTKDVKEGTGLGLAICKGIIEAHAGRIGVKVAESGGSRFWFSLPRVPLKEQRVEEKAACR